MHARENVASALKHLKSALAKCVPVEQDLGHVTHPHGGLDELQTVFSKDQADQVVAAWRAYQKGSDALIQSMELLENALATPRARRPNPRRRLRTACRR